ncbi:unnamed protein product [Gongylonema pulchrum]|uniref:Rep-A_N domain-containing protein n=1 Tax=Gongylonema pulchrum TaxID=637853 RepID=A0A183E2B7_9BILA|nr:unnamed protein product [Gongylonema pulchrum]
MVISLNYSVFQENTMISVGDLSRGFIKQICESTTYDDVETTPVVQILEARPLVNTQKEPDSEAQYFRFRISDGMFSYNSCLNQPSITEKIKRDNLSHGNPVLRMTYTL